MQSSGGHLAFARYVAIHYSGVEPPTLTTVDHSKTIDISTSELDFSRSRYPAISLQSAEFAVLKSGSKSAAYEIRTKSAKSRGLETNGPGEINFGSQPGPRS